MASALGSGGSMRMLKEEAEHLLRSIGPTWIGVRARSTPTRPRMAGSMDHPLFEHRLSARIGVQGAAVGMPTGHLTTLHLALQVRNPPRLRDDLIAVARVHRRVMVAVKYNGRDDRPGFSFVRHDAAGEVERRRAAV